MRGSASSDARRPRRAGRRCRSLPSHCGGAKPITSVSARLISPLRRGLADREALGEVMEADSRGNHDRQPGRSGRPAARGSRKLARRCRSRAEHALLALAPDPAVVIDEDQQADAGAEREKTAASPRNSLPRSPVSTDAATSDSSTGTMPAEDVPEEEEQDARRDAAERNAFSLDAGLCSRPIGRPRKIVKPARAPSDENL